VADENGRLTADELATVANYFRAKFPHGVTCPMCHNKNTEIGPHMLAPGTFGIGGLNPTPPIVYPQIFLLCRVCAHFMYFGAGTVGLTFPKAQEPSGLINALPTLPRRGGLLG